MEILHSLFYFVIAIGILVSFHEFGHFWVARKVGVKVLRFSIGFGKIIASIQKTPQSTEYVLSAIPLGGYVKMVDEREAAVKKEDLPYAFNRQPLWARTAIVAAGPVFNLLLAVFLFWCVFVLGETGMKPIVGAIPPTTLAAQAGMQKRDEIIRIDGKATPTWSEAISLLFSEAVSGKSPIRVDVKTVDDSEQTRFFQIDASDTQKPEKLYDRMGLKPWIPELQPVIGKLLPEGAAKKAGLQQGDLILTADGHKITHWMAWVNYVQKHPGKTIKLSVDRDGVHIALDITPEAVEQKGKTVGKIGAGVKVPRDLLDFLRVTYSLSPLEAIPAALNKTWFFSISTLEMMGKMLIGKASVKNLSGPISIAQYAGQSADMGFVYFLKYLGLISVSLGILNLLPVPVLDGGHLMFFAIEAIKGNPVSEKIQIYFQQLGIFLLMSLMVMAMYLDIQRLFPISGN